MKPCTTTLMHVSCPSCSQEGVPHIEWKKKFATPEMRARSPDVADQQDVAERSVRNVL